MEVERDDDDKGSDDQRNNEEISDNDLEEDEEDFLEDFYDERVKEYNQIFDMGVIDNLLVL